MFFVGWLLVFKLDGPVWIGSGTRRKEKRPLNIYIEASISYMCRMYLYTQKKVGFDFQVLRMKTHVSFSLNLVRGEARSRHGCLISD